MNKAHQDSSSFDSRVKWQQEFMRKFTVSKEFLHFEGSYKKKRKKAEILILTFTQK